MNIDPKVQLALLKMHTEKEEKAIRNAVPVGVHEIDVLLRVRGILKVSADGMALNPNKACPWLLLELALNKLNSVSVESLVEEALKIQAGDDSPLAVALKARTQQALDRIIAPTDSPRKGTAKFQGFMTEELGFATPKVEEKEQIKVDIGML